MEWPFPRMSLGIPFYCSALNTKMPRPINPVRTRCPSHPNLARAQHCPVLLGAIRRLARVRERATVHASRPVVLELLHCCATTVANVPSFRKRPNGTTPSSALSNLDISLQFFMHAVTWERLSTLTLKFSQFSAFMIAELILAGLANIQIHNHALHLASWARAAMTRMPSHFAAKRVLLSAGSDSLVRGCLYQGASISSHVST